MAYTNKAFVIDVGRYLFRVKWKWFNKVSFDIYIYIYIFNGEVTTYHRHNPGLVGRQAQEKKKSEIILIMIIIIIIIIIIQFIFIKVPA